MFFWGGLTPLPCEGPTLPLPLVRALACPPTPLPLQATNLLRALHNTREVAALGLMDSSGATGRGGGSGGSGGGAGGAGGDDRVAASWALGRRLAALFRLLLDMLHKWVEGRGLGLDILHSSGWRGRKWVGWVGGGG